MSISALPLVEIKTAEELPENINFDNIIGRYRWHSSSNSAKRPPNNRWLTLNRKRCRIEGEIRLLEKAIYFFENVLTLDHERMPELDQFKHKLKKAKITNKSIKLAQLLCT